MDKLTIQIPINEIVNHVRQAIKEEMASMSGGDQNNTINEPLCSQEEIAEYLNVSRATIINWKKRGKIPYYQVENTIRFKKSEVAKALEGKTRRR